MNFGRNYQISSEINGISEGEFLTGLTRFTGLGEGRLNFGRNYQISSEINGISDGEGLALLGMRDF